jgi:hypothetical protein
MPDCFFSAASSALNGYWLSITTQGCRWETPKFGLSSHLKGILDTDMQAFQDFQFKIDVNPLDLCPILAAIGLLPSAADCSLRCAILAELALFYSTLL